MFFYLKVSSLSFYASASSHPCISRSLSWRVDKVNKQFNFKNSIICSLKSKESIIFSLSAGYWIFRQSVIEVNFKNYSKFIVFSISKLGKHLKN